MAEPVVGADDAHVAQLGLRVLLADPEEDRMLIERRAQHPEHVGAGVERGHQLVDLGQVVAASVGEKTRGPIDVRSEEHTSELQSRQYLVCRLLLEKKKKMHHL